MILKLTQSSIAGTRTELGNNIRKQAGAELCQTQIKMKLASSEL